MKSSFTRVRHRLLRFIPLMLVLSTLFPACEDTYFYDDKEPDWLGDNIYAYLEDKGCFTYTLRLINELEYDDVMKLTGSVTLFAAPDSAWDTFFANNAWGVSRFDDLTLSQKKMLFKYGMINNAYLSTTIVNFYNGIYNENMVMRRQTALDVYDSLPYVPGDKLPALDYWDAYRTKGLYLMKDETASPMVFFAKDYLTKQIVTNQDFKLFSGGEERSGNDFHIFTTKVVKPDVVCKNGYVNIIDKVLIPPCNMADYIRNTPSTSIFSKLLDRFSAPFYDATLTANYQKINKSFTDSIFVLRYFADRGGSTTLPTGVSATNRLPFDPGWNSYAVSNDLEVDMAAMFVPTDEAMQDYLNSPMGKILGERFDWDWEKIPDDIVLPFIKRHMRTSFVESVPSRFSKMVDAENYRMPVENSHIEQTYTGVNGQVYVTNNVYPPVDYISVFSPVLLSRNTKVMKWAIEITETSAYDQSQFAFYKLYLNALSSLYSLFIPTDEYFEQFIDPIAWGQDVPAVIKYKYNEVKTPTLNIGVYATVYKYDKTTNTVGDSVGVIQNAAFLKNRLWNILDGHVVVGKVENGRNYYVTKGNDIIRVDGSGTGLTVSGGHDLSTGQTCHVTDVFRQDNGTTYFIDKPIQPALKSVYKVLSETPEFADFYALLNGVPDTCVSQIFEQDGVDYRIKFFSAFRYTVYVPTNAAVQAALSSGLVRRWDDIYAIADPHQQGLEIQKMIRFLRYHFQDDAVFVGQPVDDVYQSATIRLSGDNYQNAANLNTSVNKYYKLKVTSTDHSLSLTTETNKTVQVNTSGNLYNIVVKDFVFDKPLSSYKNVDGTGSSSGALFNTSIITTSSSAVIHQINDVLTYQ